VRKERPVVSLRHPGDHPERLSTRGRCQRSDPFQHPPQRRYGKRWGCGPPSRLAWARERHGPTGRCACGDASLAMVCCRRGPGPVPSGFPRRLGPEPSGGHVTTHIPVSGCGRTHDGSRQQTWGAPRGGVSSPARPLCRVGALDTAAPASWYTQTRAVLWSLQQLASGTRNHPGGLGPRRRRRGAPVPCVVPPVSLALRPDASTALAG